jgi:tetratricopeptide (TPR) repeat protein
VKKSNSGTNASPESIINTQRHREGCIPIKLDNLNNSGEDNMKEESTQQQLTLMSSSPSGLDQLFKEAQSLDEFGNSLFAEGKFDEALANFTQALKLKRRTLQFRVTRESDHANHLLASVAISINNIGFLRQLSGANTSEIMSAYRDSLQIKREILGDSDLSVGKTLNNIGSVLFSSHSYSDAFQAYSEAKNIFEKSLGSEHLDLAIVHSNIGDVHLAQKQLVEAHESYSVSLGIRWHALGEHHPKVIRLLEKIAAIEMSHSPHKMKQIMIQDDDEEKAEAPVRQEISDLRNQVKDDIIYIENVHRCLAMEMMKDEIQLIQGMRDLTGETNCNFDKDNSSYPQVYR